MTILTGLATEMLTKQQLFTIYICGLIVCMIIAAVDQEELAWFGIGLVWPLVVLVLFIICVLYVSTNVITECTVHQTIEEQEPINTYHVQDKPVKFTNEGGFYYEEEDD